MSFVTDQISKIKSNAIDKFNEMTSWKILGNPFGCPLDDQKSVIKVIFEGSAFQNNMASVTDEIKESIGPTNEYLNKLKDKLPEGWSKNDVDKLINKLNIFDSTMNKFREWTDRISGVVKIPGLPDVDTILSTMNSFQQMTGCNGFDIPDSQKEAKKMMGSLLIDKVKTDYSSSYINSIPSLIQNGVNSTTIIQALEENELIYTDAMISDDNAFKQAITSLTNQATGLNISTMDPFNSGYQMLVDKCGSDKLKNLIK